MTVLNVSVEALITDAYTLASLPFDITFKGDGELDVISKFTDFCGHFGLTVKVKNYELKEI